MKRGLLFGVLICLVSGGLSRVHLVARGREEVESPRAERQAEERMGD